MTQRPCTFFPPPRAATEPPWGWGRTLSPSELKILHAQLDRDERKLLAAAHGRKTTYDRIREACTRREGKDCRYPFCNCGPVVPLEETAA